MTSSSLSESCECYDGILTYKCEVNGGLATRWRGSALQCDQPGDIIFLHNTNFEGSKRCNDKVSVHAIHSDQELYKSQLRVNITESLMSFTNKTVICSSELVNSTDLNNYYVESTSINISIGMHDYFPISELLKCTVCVLLESPSDIWLKEIMPGQLTFAWKLVDNNCRRSPSVYQVTSYNCGKCDVVQVNEIATCTCVGVRTNGTLCEFSVQTAVCNITGSQISTVNISLKGKVHCVYRDQINLLRI